MGKYYSEKTIRKAQKWLQGVGSKVQINGLWTIGMQTAVVCFQRRNDLPVTGDLDKTTWKLLKKQNSWWWRLFHKKVSK